ncbi:MAG: hypothetical protein JSW48_11080 [Betaproteobacteria bacterium]|jgi:hypothetical protein|nr:MAG: hypothetical protein JSW48_11080 [Betaproteobacteria bacterium]
MMNRFFANFLFILAAWTIVIKYLFPIAYAIDSDLPLGTHVYLDFWPVVHMVLGWSLLHWRRYTFEFAVAVSIAEIVIIISKFVVFLAAPEWTIWRTNWFINKIFVLSCFVMLLTWLLLNASSVRAMQSVSSTAKGAAG